MTDCSQLQALLDDAIQERQAMDQENYCIDQCDAGDVECIKQCRMSLPQWKKQKDQEIANLEFSMGLCGTWSLVAQVQGGTSGNFEGNFIITGGFAELTGTMSTSDALPDTTFRGSYDSGQSTVRLLRNINDANVQYEDYRGTVDFSTTPPSMAGEMSYIYQPGISGTDPLFAWTAQKQS